MFSKNNINCNFKGNFEERLFNRQRTASSVVQMRIGTGPGAMIYGRTEAEWVHIFIGKLHLRDQTVSQTKNWGTERMANTCLLMFCFFKCHQILKTTVRAIFKSSWLYVKLPAGPLPPLRLHE